MNRFIAGCLLMLPLLLSGQEYREINVQHLDTKQGLLHHTINSLYQDEFGFIWIGTMDGLSRYDGRKMTSFKPSPNDTTTICENNIRAVCGDGNGHIFVKGLNSVSYYDIRTDRFKVIRKSGVGAIFSATGRLLMAIDGDIFSYDVTTGSDKLLFSFKSHRLSGVRIASFAMSDDGQLFICTKRNGYYRIDSGGNIVQHTMLGEANSVLLDSKSNIWIATRTEGLYCIDTMSRLRRYEHDPSDFSSLGHNNVRQVCEDGSGNLFVGTFAGLSLLNVETHKFTHYHYELKRAAFNIRSIITMMRDHQGTLWIGTFYEGLHCYNMEYDIYRYYYPAKDVPNRLSSPIVSAIAEDSKGTIWIGTEGGGLNSLDVTSRQIRSYGKGSSGYNLSSDVIKSLLYEPEDDVLWVATLYDGVNRIDLRRGTVQQVSKRIMSNDIWRGDAQNIVNMFPFGDSLLLATNQGVIVLDKRTMSLSRFDLGLTFDSRSQIWDIALDKEGLLWFTTSTYLFSVNPKSRMSKRYLFKDISSSRVNNHLNAILCDSKGRLWFGSSGSGIFLYDHATDSFKNYSSAHGLENGHITDIGEDPSTGNIYIATNFGLSRFDSSNESFVNFNIRNGFPLTTINDNSLFISASHTLYACGLNGLVSVAPAQLGEHTHNYSVYISDVSIDNSHVKPLQEDKVLDESVLYQRSIKLRPRNSVVSFEFTNTDFMNTSHTKMEYKLEGFDKQFIEAGESNITTYTNLSPGRYTFIVRGRTLDDKLQYPTTSVEVVVLPPFYRSSLFIVLCIALVVAIITYLIRSYAVGVKLRSSLELEHREKSHIEQVNLSKFRFFTNISHEFRTPLTLINGQLEMMLQRNDIRPSIYSKILSVYKNSQRLRRLVDEIIDINKQEQGFMKLKVCQGDMVSFLQEIFRSFEEYAIFHNIKFVFSAPEGRVMVWFDSDEMSKVVNNLLSNAFKYSKSGSSISLNLTDRGDDVLIEVRDTGLGILAEHIDHIFERFYQDDTTNAAITLKGSGVGLALTKAIVEMHGGEISVESQPGVQTVFSVVLLKGDHFSGDNVVKVAREDKPNKYIEDYGAVDLSQPPLQLDESFKSVKILIVEDSREVREMLTQIFESIYSVFVANDGEQGVMRAKEIQPDIILSDIMMPKMSGVAMCSKLKNDIDTCHIPIVLLTARNAEEHTIEGLQTGADDYITKPFNVRLLVARCNNLISGRRRLQQKYQSVPDSSVTMLTTNPTDQKLLTRAVEIAREHIGDISFDINTFSKELGISRTYLFAKIKGLTGQTPNEFVVNLRLKEAARRLVSDLEATMSDIAYDNGFNSPGYFARCFKEVYGKTPYTYRKEMTRKNSSKVGE